VTSQGRELNGVVVGVTGASSGSGRAPGWCWPGTGRRPGQAGAACQAADGQALAVPTDVTDQSAVTSDAGLVHVRSASPAVDGADACAHGGCARNRVHASHPPHDATLGSAADLRDCAGTGGLHGVVNDPSIDGKDEVAGSKSETRVCGR
jgi:hypothetical protein